MTYRRSPRTKAAICAAIYPGLTILLGVALQAAPLPGATKILVRQAMGWVLWPVRWPAESVLEAIDRATPLGADEPRSMFLPLWQLNGLFVIAVLVTATLVFLTSLTLFRWLESHGR